MDKLIKYAGIAITVLTLLGGAVTGYSKLQNKVEVLNDKVVDLKLANSEQDKKLSETEKALIKQEVNQEAILKVLDKIDKRLERIK